MLYYLERMQCDTGPLCFRAFARAYGHTRTSTLGGQRYYCSVSRTTANMPSETERDRERSSEIDKTNNMLRLRRIEFVLGKFSTHTHTSSKDNTCCTTLAHLYCALVNSHTWANNKICTPQRMEIRRFTQTMPCEIQSRTPAVVSKCCLRCCYCAMRFMSKVNANSRTHTRTHDTHIHTHTNWARE